jgi:hypothetical protein
MRPADEPAEKCVCGRKMLRVGPVEEGDEVLQRVGTAYAKERRAAQA